MRSSVPIETQGRIAADMARDLLDLYFNESTPAPVRLRVKSELRRLEPQVAQAAHLNVMPFPRRGTGLSLDRINSALDAIRLHAEILADA